MGAHILGKDIVGMYWGKFNNNGELSGEGQIISKIEEGYYLLYEYDPIGKPTYGVAHLSDMKEWALLDSTKEFEKFRQGD